MVFDANSYGPGAAEILALDGDGRRAMPLVIGEASSDEARAALQGRHASELFAGSRAPEAALSGLWLYFSFFDEAHSIAQDIHTPDGSYWHGILHRQEPDPGNAGYWFRKVGRHPIFSTLHDEAERVLSARADRVRFAAGGHWDPFAFIDFCEYARQRPGSGDERAAQEIQLIEWQLLFDYCARPA